MNTIDVTIAARRMIDVIQCGGPARLPFLFSEIGIDLETLGLDEALAILCTLRSGLEMGDYPPDFVQSVLSAAPFAKAGAQMVVEVR